MATLAELARRASAGPWYIQASGVRNADGFVCVGIVPSRFPYQEARYEQELAEHEATIDFIAAANPAAILDLIAAHERRVQGLLEANNRYLDRARAAEGKAKPTAWEWDLSNIGGGLTLYPRAPAGDEKTRFRTRELFAGPWTGGPEAKADPPLPSPLEECYRSGQMSEAQHQAHVKAGEME